MELEQDYFEDRKMEHSELVNKVHWMERREVERDQIIISLRRRLAEVQETLNIIMSRDRDRVDQLEY